MKTLIIKIAQHVMLMCLLVMMGYYSHAQVTTPIVTANGKWEIYTHGDTIKITFRPDSLAVTCAKIGFVQTAKATSYSGGTGTVLDPGTLSKNFKHLTDDVTGGTFVDHIYCEKDGYYNGDDTQDDPQQGASAGDGSVPTNSFMEDAPHLPMGAGVDSIVVEFEVCAMCMDGSNPPTCYGCIKWKYKQTSNAAGTSTLVPGGVAAESPEHAAALVTFTTNHTSGAVAICPEKLLDDLAGIFKKIYDNFHWPFYFKSNHFYDVISAGSRITKGPAMPGGTLPILPVGNVIAPGDFVFVPAGERICLRMINFVPSTDPLIPFSASFNDLYYGSQEVTQTGIASGFLHQGIRVKNCSGITLCAAAPVNTTDAASIIMYTARVDNALQRVVIKNNALSTQGLNCKNVLSVSSPATMLNPGDSVVYNFPGQVPACASTLKLKLFIEGYYRGNNDMSPVLMNQLEPSTNGQCDTVTVELRSPVPPFLIMQSTKAVLNQDGTLTCNFPALNGQFFIAVRHRNAIETWSANPVFFNQGMANYDFTDAPTKAFGANQIQVSPGVWAFYSGDVNQDQSIDLLDLPEMENDINNFLYGYFSTDLNGDGNVDLLDTSVEEPNISNFIFSNTPNN